MNLLIDYVTKVQDLGSINQYREIMKIKCWFLGICLPAAALN